MARQVVPGGHAVGLGLSEDLISEAIACTAPLGLLLRFEAVSAMALTFETVSFDAVRIERTLQDLPVLAGAACRRTRRR